MTEIQSEKERDLPKPFTICETIMNSIERDLKKVHHAKYAIWSDQIKGLHGFTKPQLLFLLAKISTGGF